MSTSTDYKKQLIMGIETTAGTALALVDADHNIKFTGIEIDPEVEEYVMGFASGRYSYGQSTMGKRKCKIKARAPKLLGATAGTPPKIGKAFRSCGAVQKTVLTFSASVVTSNVINGTVNGVAITAVTYSSSEAVTLAAVGANILAKLALQTPTVVGTATVSTTNHSVTIEAPADVALTGFAVTLGASQATVAYSVTWSPSAAYDEGNGVNATFAVQYTFTSGSCLQFLAKGGGGTWTETLENGAVVCDFEWEAAFVSVTDTTALVLTSPDSGPAPQFVVGATVTVAGETKQFDNYSFVPGNSGELMIDNAEATGYQRYVIRGRNPEFSLNPRMRLLANDASFTRWIAGTQSAISAATATVSSIKWTLTAPKASLKGDGNKNGLRGQETTFDQTYSLRESTGSDEWVMTQSA